MATSTTATELRDSGRGALVAKLKEAKEELFNLRFQAATGQLENHDAPARRPSRTSRASTPIMRERELEAELDAIAACGR
jgi:large subunit ribosomal protein L29